MNQDKTRTLFQSLSAVGPMLNVIGLFSVIAGIVGGYLFYAVLLSFFITILNVYLPYRSSKEIKSNGGYYTIVGKNSGKSAGLYTSIIYAIYGYSSFPSITLFNFSFLLYIIRNLPIALFLTVIISVLEIILVNWGVESTLRFLKYFSIMEIAFLFALDVVMLYNGNLVLPAIGPRSVLSGNFWTGILFSLLIFAGLGSPLFISENLTHSKRNMYIGIILAYLISGLMMIFTAMSIEMFLGSEIISYSTNPFFILNLIYERFGVIFYVMTIAIAVTSATNLSLAYLNAWRNSINKMSQDGILPKIDGKKFMYYALLLNLGILFIMAYEGTEFIGFVFFTGLVSLSYLTTHTIANISYLKSLRSKKEYIGMIILIGSSILMFITITLTVYDYLYSFIEIPVAYAIMLAIPLLWVANLKRSKYMEKLELHYQ